jgi:hypothetical protein
MDKTPTSEELAREIGEVKRQLLELGPIHPGSISSQYHACGNPSCHCHDPVDPQKHGPYSKLTYSHCGKPSCRFVRPDFGDELQHRIDNYKLFRELTAKWVDLAILAGKAEFFDNAAERTSTPSSS